MRPRGARSRRCGRDPALFDRVASVARRYCAGDVSGFIAAMRAAGLSSPGGACSSVSFAGGERR